MSSVLGYSEIKRRFSEIFVNNTASEKNIRAASYDLRLGADSLMFGGRWFQKGGRPVREIKIGPGEIVILSTIERFTMPTDIVGTVNVKFKYSLRGLISMFGSRVDPGYGKDNRESVGDPYTSQRLYLAVCNASQKDINLRPGDSIFMIEFHTVQGEVIREERQNNDTYMQNEVIPEALDRPQVFGVSSYTLETINKLTRRVRAQTSLNLIIGLGLVALLAVTILASVLTYRQKEVVTRVESTIPAQIGFQLAGIVSGVHGDSTAIKQLIGITLSVGEILLVYDVSLASFKEVGTNKADFLPTAVIKVVSLREQTAICLVFGSPRVIKPGDIVIRP